MIIIKLTGPQFTANSSNLPTTIPTNAGAGSNAGSSANIAGPDFTGYGNATAGGATHFRVLNTTTGLVTLTIANNGANVGSYQILSNTEGYVFEKYPYDTVTVSNNSNLVFFNPIAIKW